MVKQESQRRLRSAAPVQVVRILHRGAEAGRTDHGAVAAGQAALGDIVPARMFQVGQQQVAHIVRAHLPAHVAFRPGDGVCRHGRMLQVGRPVRHRRQQRRTAFAADLHQEFMLVRDQFGQREVVAFCRLGAGVHRCAEARATGLAAIHRDDERALAPRLVVRIDVGSLQEHAILYGDRVQLAGSHREEGVALRRLGGLRHRHAICGLLGPPHSQQRRMQESLPGVRPDIVTEQRRVLPSLDAVMPAILFVGPARRQVAQ